MSIIGKALSTIDLIVRRMTRVDLTTTSLRLLVGALVLAAVTQVFAVLGLVDRREAFSPQSLRALRRTRTLVAAFAAFAAFAAYLAVGLVGFWAVVGLMHIALLLAWFVTEVAAVAVLTVLGRVERSFAEALLLRRGVELTV